MNRLPQDLDSDWSDAVFNPDGSFTLKGEPRRMLEALAKQLGMTPEALFIEGMKSCLALYRARN